jgi:nucleoid-associated protein YgaU
MRYDNNDILTNPKRYYATAVFPKIVAKETDIYIISRTGDRLDLLAYEYYQNTDLWFVIANANNIGKGTFIIPPGKQIRIPFPLTVFEVEQALQQAKQAR